MNSYSDYPEYMKREHWKWLSHRQKDSAIYSLNECLNSFWNSSIDRSFMPTVDPILSDLSLSNLWFNIDVLQAHSVLETFQSPVGFQTCIEVVKAYQEDKDFERKKSFLARCQAANIVLTSSFAIGYTKLERGDIEAASLLFGELSLDVLKVKASVDAMILMHKVSVSSLAIDASRLQMASAFQFNQLRVEFEGKSALEPLRVWDYATHVIASIHGAAGYNSFLIANQLEHLRNAAYDKGFWVNMATQETSAALGAISEAIVVGTTGIPGLGYIIGETIGQASYFLYDAIM